MHESSAEIKKFIENVKHILYGYEHLEEDEVEEVQSFKKEIRENFITSMEAYITEVLAYIPENQHDHIDRSSIKTDFMNDSIRNCSEMTMYNLARLYAIFKILETNNYPNIDLDMFHNIEPKPSEMAKEHLDYFVKDMRMVIINPIDTACTKRTKKVTHVCGDVSYIGTWHIIKTTQDIIKQPEKIIEAIEQDPRFYVPEFFNTTINALKEEIGILSAGLINTNIGQNAEMNEAWAMQIEALNEAIEDICFVFDQWKALNPENTPNARRSNRFTLN